MTATDPKEIVRDGYDAVSSLYRPDDADVEQYRRWFTELRSRLRPNSTVLDLGCGCGVPMVRDLVDAGYTVTGVDFSEVQVRRARELVPAATFIQADVTTIDFEPTTFDAVICLYTLIHVPLDEQPPLLRSVAGWLRPGGWLLATTGDTAWTGTENDWLGGGAPMWWSQADASTYRSWMTSAGLVVEAERFVPEGDGGHALFWARRPR